MSTGDTFAQIDVKTALVGLMNSDRHRDGHYLPGRRLENKRKCVAEKTNRCWNTENVRNYSVLALLENKQTPVAGKQNSLLETPRGT